jgi:hypothetical protein
MYISSIYTFTSEEHGLWWFQCRYSLYYQSMNLTNRIQQAGFGLTHHMKRWVVVLLSSKVSMSNDVFSADNNMKCAWLVKSAGLLTSGVCQV